MPATIKHCVVFQIFNLQIENQLMYFLFVGTVLMQNGLSNFMVLVRFLCFNNIDVGVIVTLGFLRLGSFGALVTRHSRII